MRRAVYSPFSLATFVAPHKPKQSGRCHGGNMVTRIGHQSCWRVIATVVLNRGDSANSTSVQRLTPTRIQTQAGMRKQA